MMECPNGFNPMHLITIFKEKKISSLTIMANTVHREFFTTQFMKALNGTPVELLEVSVSEDFDLPIEFMQNCQLQMFCIG